MGEVWEAVHHRLQHTVAIKFLRGDRSASSSRLQRFVAESRTIASIESDRIVRVLDAGETEDGTPYFVMERLRGRSLRVLLSERRVLSELLACSLLSDACRGVAAAHRAGVLHRDLKPENLFVVDDEGSVPRLKVLDFGVAKRAGHGGATREGALIGTVCYMSPEQALGEPVDYRSDIYALGMILFEALSGVPFNSGRTESAQLLRVLDPGFDRESISDKVSPAVARIIRRATARNAGERFLSASELAVELERLVSTNGVGLTRADTHNGERLGTLRSATELRPVGAPKLVSMMGLVSVASAAVGVAIGSNMNRGQPPDDTVVSRPTAAPEWCPAASAHPPSVERVTVEQQHVATSAESLMVPAPRSAVKARNIAPEGVLPLASAQPSGDPHPAPPDVGAPQPEPTRLSNRDSALLGRFITHNPYVEDASKPAGLK